jgi:hypothetical protein
MLYGEGIATAVCACAFAYDTDDIFAYLYSVLPPTKWSIVIIPLPGIAGAAQLGVAKNDIFSLQVFDGMTEAEKIDYFQKFHYCYCHASSKICKI